MGYKVVEESVVEQRDGDHLEDHQHKGRRLRGGRRGQSMHACVSRKSAGMVVPSAAREAWGTHLPSRQSSDELCAWHQFRIRSVGVRRVALLRELGASLSRKKHDENWTFGTPGGPESRFRVLESEKGKNAS